MKIYISGKISNLPIEIAQKHFEDGEEHLNFNYKGKINIFYT